MSPNSDDSSVSYSVGSTEFTSIQTRCVGASDRSGNMDTTPYPPTSKSINSSKDMSFQSSPRKLVTSSIDTTSFVSSTSKSYKSPSPLHQKPNGIVMSKMNQILVAQQDNINDALADMNERYKYHIAAWKIYYFITFIRVKKLKKLNIKLLNTNNYNSSLLDKCTKKTKLLSLTIQHQSEEMEKLKQDKEDLQEELALEREKYDKSVDEMTSNYQNVVTELTSNFDVKVEELSLLQSFQNKHKDDMQTLVEVNSKLKYELEVTKDACKDLVLEMAQLKSEMELLNQRNNITLQQVQDLESIILKQTELVDQLTASLSNQKNDAEERVSKYEEHIEILDKRLAEAASNEGELHNEIAQLKAEISELKSNVNQSRINHDRINNEKALVNNAMAVMVETMNEQKSKLEQSSKTIQKLKDEIKYLSKSKRKSSNMSGVRENDRDEYQDNTTEEYYENKSSYIADGEYENSGTIIPDFADDVDRVAWNIVNNSNKESDEIIENNEVDEEKNSINSLDIKKNSNNSKDEGRSSKRDSSVERDRGRSGNYSKDDSKSGRRDSSDRSRSSRDDNRRSSNRRDSSDRSRSSRDDGKDDNRSSSNKRDSSNDRDRDRDREKNRKSSASSNPDSSQHRSASLTPSKYKTEEMIAIPDTSTNLEME